jgi:hypothetical protein
MIQLHDTRKEYYLKVQPFRNEGIYLKRRGDRYILVGNTKAKRNGKPSAASLLEKAGFRFDTNLRAWIMPPRKADAYIYQVVGDALGIKVDMRKYHQHIGTERKRNLRPMKYDRGVMASYIEATTGLIGKLSDEIKSRILPVLKAKENQYATGGTGQAEYLEEVTNAIATIKRNLNIDHTAKTIAEAIIGKADRINRQRMEKYVNESTGLNVTL